MEPDCDIIKIEETSPHVLSLIELANNKDADAMYELGVCLLKGEGCRLHTKTGIKILQEAKSMGSTLAAAKLENIDYLVNPPSQRRIERKIENIDSLVNPPSQRRIERKIEQKEPKQEPLEIPWVTLYIFLTLVVSGIAVNYEWMDGIGWVWVIALMIGTPILIGATCGLFEQLNDGFKTPLSAQERTARAAQVHLVKSNLDRAEMNQKLDEIVDRLDF
ncbi:MAG: hypothetical protein SFY80_05985 [Verrucomicrobiota bacterium]|nr:hypothetical protein [Verrucomicrobiota bacterium]